MPPPIVYRSARIVVQNSTAVLWTLDAAEVIGGDWARGCDPARQLRDLPPQAAVVFTNQSTELRVGAEGFARYSSIHGQLHVTWSRPWVGAFETTVQLSDEQLAHTIRCTEASPAFPAAMIDIHPRRGSTSAWPESTARSTSSFRTTRQSF